MTSLRTSEIISIAISKNTKTPSIKKQLELKMLNEFTITSMDIYRNYDEVGFLVNFKLDGKNYEWAINDKPFDFEIREGEGDEDPFNLVAFEDLPENVRVSLTTLQNHLKYLLEVGYLD